MVTQVGSLVIDLIAETASFQANIKRATSTLNSEAAAMRRSLAAIEGGVNAIKIAGSALIANEIVGQVQRLVGAGLDYASSLGEVSQQLGVTTEDLQVYRYAASQVGISQEEMDRGLQKLTRSLGQAQLGNKQMLATFAALGVTVRTTDGQLRSTSEVLPDIAAALGRIPDPAKRAAVETQLFGRAGQQLDTLLAGGSGAIDELRNAAQRLGLVLSDDAIANADATADKLAEVKQVLEARIAAAVAENSKAILELADGFLTLTTRVLQFVSAWNQAGDTFAKRDGFVSRAQAMIDGNKYLSDAEKAQARGLIEKRADQRFGVTTTSYLGGLIQYRSAAPPKLPSAETVRQQIAPLGTSSGDLDNLFAGGSGGAKKDKAADAAKKLTEDFTRELKAMQIEQIRALGDNFRADLMQKEAVILERFVGLDKERLKVLLDQNFALAGQKAARDDLDKLLGKNDAIQLKGWDGMTRDILDTDQLQTQLRDIAGMNRKAADEVKFAWVDSAQGILYSMDSVARGLTGQGSIFDVMSGLLELFMQLGSIGVFGGAIGTNIRASRGFSSGGYTGNLGTSEVAGFVHGQEFVFDASAVQRIGLDNLERLRRGNGFMRGGYTGGAMLAALADTPRRDPIIIEPSPYFNAVVDGRATAVATPIGMRAASAGSSMAQSDIARSRKNRIPGR